MCRLGCGRGPDQKSGYWESTAVVQIREGGHGGVSSQNVLGRQNQYDEQVGCLSQKRSGKGVKANSMTLDWPTQKSGLSHAELGVPEMERGLWLKSHL